MHHLEHPIICLVARLEVIKQQHELNPDNTRLKTVIHQFEHAINILKKHEEKK